MRLGVIPEGIIDRIALVSGKLPIPLLETFWGIALGSTVITGTRLGVFESLAKNKKTAEEVAKDVKCDAQAMKTLLNALNGFGYLRRRKGVYSLTKKAGKWLTTESHSSMRDAILFMGELFNILGDIETAVKSGKTEDFHSPDKTPEFWKYYIRGLATFARSAGREIVRKVSLNKEPKRLLDIGGGHGMYSVAFCRKYASLQAVVLDLPGAVEQGKSIVREKGFEDRVRFRQGDLKITEWGKGYDLVLLFNIIHTVSPEEAPRILARAYQSLNPGGTVVILDSEHTGNEKDLSATSGFNELLFFIINGTCVYPEKDIRKWMTDAGFINLKKKKLLIMPMTLFITGRKPS